MPSKYWKDRKHFFNGSTDGVWDFFTAYLPALFQNFEAGSAIQPFQRVMLNAWLGYYPPGIRLTFDDLQALDKIPLFNPERHDRNDMTGSLYACVVPRNQSKTTLKDAFTIFEIAATYVLNQIKEQQMARFGRFNVPKNIGARHIVYYALTEKKVADDGKNIRDAFTNPDRYPEFYEDFGHLLVNVEKKKDKEDVFSFDDEENEATVKRQTALNFRHGVFWRGKGDLQPVTGAKIGAYRPDRIWLDDIEDPKHGKNTPEQMAERHVYYTNTVLNSLDIKTGKMFAIGTIFKLGCLMDRLVAKYDKDDTPEGKIDGVRGAWTRLDFRQIEKDGVLLNPLRFPMATIENLRQKALLDLDASSDGMKGFLRDYYGIVQGAVNVTKVNVHRPEEYSYDKASKEIVYRNPLGYLERKACWLQLGLDGGGTAATQDPTGIVVIARTGDDHRWVVHASEEKKSPIGGMGREDGYADMIYRMAIEWSLDAIFIEAYGTQAHLYDAIWTYIRDLDKRNGTRVSRLVCPYGKQQSSRGKRERFLQAFDMVIENGLLHVKRGEHDNFLKQLQAMVFESESRDHLCDAAVMAEYNSQMPVEREPYRHLITRQSAVKSLWVEMHRRELKRKAVGAR